MEIDAEQRRPIEAETGFDFSAVRIHQDSHAQRAALSINARAYTIGSHIFLGSNEFRLNTPAEQRLLSHELRHVIQQSASGSVWIQREMAEAATSNESPTLLQQAYDAADQSRWEVVAGLVHQLSAEHRRYFLDSFKRSPEQVAEIHQGALGNPAVGPESPIAEETKIIYLDVRVRQQLRRKDNSRAAFFLNQFNRDDIVNRLKGLPSDTVKGLHEGAMTNPELGQDSAAAKITAEILEQRSAQGDTHALLLPTVRGEGAAALAAVMRTVDGISPSGNPSRPFTFFVDGQPVTLTAEQAERVRHGAAAALRDHLKQIRAKSHGTLFGYKSLQENDRKRWIVAPIVKTIGRVKDPGPTLLAYIARSDRNAEAAFAAIAAGNLEVAAGLLADAERQMLSADRMWRAYFRGTISAGEMTITGLEITEAVTALTLAVIAAIVTGGAAAGALAGAEGAGAATTTVAGYQVGSVAAANTVVAAAPIAQNLALAAAKVSMGDPVDWGAFFVDTIVQIFIARYGGRLTGGIAEALAANPATESLSARVTSSLVHSLLLHAESTALTTAAQDAYRTWKGQKVTVQTVVDDAWVRLTDPAGVAVALVTGALSSAAHHGAQAAATQGTPLAPRAPHVEHEASLGAPPEGATKDGRTVSTGDTETQTPLVPTTDSSVTTSAPQPAILPSYHEIDPGPVSPGTVELDRGPQPTRSTTHNEIDLGRTPTAGSPELIEVGGPKPTTATTKDVPSQMDRRGTVSESSPTSLSVEEFAAVKVTELEERIEALRDEALMDRLEAIDPATSEGLQKLRQLELDIGVREEGPAGQRVERDPVKKRHLDVPALLNLPEYQESIGRASDAFAGLPDIESKKNIAAAAGGEPSTSGYAGEKERHTERVQIAGAEAGHESEPHPFDKPGSEGSYENSHSERHQAEQHPGQQEFASSKAMCPQCLRWFSAQAKLHGPYFVGDPNGVNVFFINGAHEVVPHPSGAVTNAPKLLH
ncbi:eCIS core domain-containing protein [Mycobacterium sp. C3-094]